MGLTAAERQRAYRERVQARVDAMPKVPCACGCGTPIPPINKMRKPARYALGHNPDGTATRFTVEAPGRRKSNPRGPEHHRWRGGEHPNGGYVRRVISPAEAAIWPTAVQHRNKQHWTIQRGHVVWNTAHPDDVVKPGDEVHHINRVRDDDRIENLIKLGRAEHRALHKTELGT